MRNQTTRAVRIQRAIANRGVSDAPASYLRAPRGRNAASIGSTRARRRRKSTRPAAAARVVRKQIAAMLLRDRTTTRLLARAERTYAARRAGLVSALATRGIDAAGDSGLGVWVPLADEAAAMRELLVQGWAVSPGERYRFDTPPASGSRPQTSSRTRPSSLATPSRRSGALRRARIRADAVRAGPAFKGAPALPIGDG